MGKVAQTTFVLVHGTGHGGCRAHGPMSSWMEPFAARARKLKWDVYNVEASHDIMITHPNELAEILLQIADKVHVFRNEKMKR